MDKNQLMHKYKKEMFDMIERDKAWQKNNTIRYGETSTILEIFTPNNSRTGMHNSKIKNKTFLLMDEANTVIKADNLKTEKVRFLIDQNILEKTNIFEDYVEIHLSGRHRNVNKLGRTTDMTDNCYFDYEYLSQGRMSRSTFDYMNTWGDGEYNGIVTDISLINIGQLLMIVRSHVVGRAKCDDQIMCMMEFSVYEYEARELITKNFLKYGSYELAENGIKVNQK